MIFRRFFKRQATIESYRFTLVIFVAGFLAGVSCAAPNHQSTLPAASAGSPAPLLNSERIRQKFGSYGIDVLSESENLRVSNLYSFENGRKIMRTLAVVIYPQSIPGSVTAAHSEIKSGQSIGEVFKRHGWLVEKQDMCMGEIPASSDFAGVYASMGGIAETNLALHVYRLSVSKGGLRSDYALIAEIHHPDYLDAKQLRDIYAGALAGPEPCGRGIDHTLEIVTSVMKNQKPPQSSSFGLNSASRWRWMSCGTGS